MIRNFLDHPKQVLASSHEGQGPVDLYELWSSRDFQSNCDFFDRVVIPPQKTIGYHQHGNNEEMYIILGGKGTMTISGQPIKVKKGDMILNPPFGEHGLTNDSDADIDVLILQISIDES